jgi:hypothetical protein
MKNEAVVIVCRSSDEPLKPGNVVGYQCKYCGTRLQVSPTGIAMFRQHPEAEFLCNPCGMLYAAFAEEMGKLTMKTGPEADKYIASDKAKGNPFAEWTRQRRDRDKEKS